MCEKCFDTVERLKESPITAKLYPSMTILLFVDQTEKFVNLIMALKEEYPNPKDIVPAEFFLVSEFAKNVARAAELAAENVATVKTELQDEKKKQVSRQELAAIIDLLNTLASKPKATTIN